MTASATGAGRTTSHGNGPDPRTLRRRRCHDEPHDVSRATAPRARRAVGAAFFAQGFTFISLTTRLPQIMDRAGVHELGQSLLLLLMVLLAGAGSAGAEKLAATFASATVPRGGLLAIAAGVPIIVLSPNLSVLIAGMACYGLGLGMVDATTNMQAVAVEAAYRRPILPSFHGAWTVGGILASALTLATASLPWGSTAVVAVVPAVTAAAPFLARGRASSTAELTGASIQVPWRPIILVGIAMVLFYMVDTAATTWGPTYLDHTLAAPQQLLALATLPYLLASGVQRLAGDILVARFGPVAVVRTGRCSPRWPWRSWCSPPPGRWRCAALPCSGSGWR